MGEKYKLIISINLIVDVQNLRLRIKKCEKITNNKIYLHQLKISDGYTKV